MHFEKCNYCINAIMTGEICKIVQCEINASPNLATNTCKGFKPIKDFTSGELSPDLLKRRPFNTTPGALNMVCTKSFDPKTCKKCEHSKKFYCGLLQELSDQLIGKKFDAGKPRLAETIQDFRIPLTEISKVWAFGADKYEKGNWRYVENGLDRYTNAMLRHLCAEADNFADDESELAHAAHVAWNALARLHFIMEAKKPEENHE